MTDYTDQGAVPVEDAVVDDPPTVDEVRERQRQEYPEQARTAMYSITDPLLEDPSGDGDNGGA